jgi:hypothetical protein
MQSEAQSFLGLIVIVVRHEFMSIVGCVSMPTTMFTEFILGRNEFYCPLCAKRGDQNDFVSALRRRNNSCGKLNADEIAMKAANEERLLRLYSV